MRQIPSVPRMPDLLAFSFVAGWVVHIGGPALELVVPTTLYLVGVALLAIALSATVSATREPQASSGRLPWLAATAATLSSSLPSVDSVTLAALELPGMVVAFVFVYSVARAGIALLPRAA